MKHFAWFLALLLGLVLVVSGDHEEAEAASGGNNDNEVKRGLAIAPVPLDLRGRNRRLVGLGSYIVNVQANCNGCHTVDFEPYLPGSDPFAGEPEIIDPNKYLVGGSAFGPFVSRNLRPDPQTRLPAGYTLEEFRWVLRTGVDLKNIPPEPLLQVMPWPSFRKLTDRDIRAIYEYLSALPPAQPPVADAGADRNVVDHDNDGSERVTLDGTRSSDADGTIASYQWLENGQVFATGAAPTVSLAVGVHTLTLRVTDNDGFSDEEQVIITVEQLEP